MLIECGETSYPAVAYVETTKFLQKIAMDLFISGFH